MITSRKVVRPPPHRVDPPSPIESAVGARLHLICHGISPVIISEITGMSYETCRRYLRGDTPSLLFVARLCHALDISTDWLMLGRGQPCHSRRVQSTTSGTLAERHLDDLTRLLSQLRAQAALRSDPTATPKTPAPRQAQDMDTSTPRQIRLLLGPADGCSITLTSEPEDEIRVILDIASGEVAIAKRNKAPGEHQTLCRYKKVLPTVYRWIDPVREYA